MIVSNDLLLVQRIVEHGSLTKAADSLFLTQSALSHQLKDLENRTGLQIFERVNKKLLLTHAGRRIMEGAGSILPQLSRLNEDIHAFKKGKLSSLRISTECYTCYHWLPEVITRLKSRLDQVEISIVAAATQRPLEYLLNGELDLAIVSEKPDHPAIHTTPLFSDNLVAVLPRNHPYTRSKTALTADDFTTEDLLIYDAQGEHTQFSKEFFREVSPKSITRIQLTEAIVEMINAGMGVGIFATWVIAPYLKNRDIVTMPLKTPFKKRTWRAATLSKHHLLVPPFVAAVKEYFK
ncbi:LysR family transcriptional regulator [Chitinophaga arvensicola]|uniref:LysR family transcriptional regulator, regulator for metE and metH n=1 Tax=Chitinophaga arvensicola TaxID=29529 RepID=A0A1I0S8C1_9BACT|nr:LysR family transcriptional regulator [Chitinophaga arvensicola]SEW52273.1 LysR family transcriptional regulator, regulator for metE and metH [Chitinophaga arvensicola]